MIQEAFGLMTVVMILVGIGFVVFIFRLYHKVEQGRALIISKWSKVDVTFTGGVVLPVVHKAERMDISVKTIEIDRSGADGLICQDNIRADIKVTFFVKVNKTREDVIKVAQAIGCARASDQQTLEALFSAKFSEALKTVGKQLEFVDLYTKRNEFRDQIIDVIGTDLNGYVLEDAAIDYLEQTPITELDEHNILDAQGIRKITELTTIEHVRTNDFLNTEKKQITQQDVEAAEAIFELERQKADAFAKQQREIETVKSREEAETLKVQAEENQKAELARIRATEELGVQEENQKRQVEVAEKNRERVIAVETERVEKERQLEMIARERETELQRIAKDKEVEHEKREIAEVVRERIMVEKTVAEQEEAIKRLRVVEEAERTKQSLVIAAEAEAEEALVKDIKAAEAAESASEHKAREEINLADAKLEASDRLARAMIRTAEGVQAEAAAPGLADVEVKEQGASALEKEGLAEAKVLREKGLAEAEAIREKLKGEAAGLADKAASMKALDDASRAHEEYRLRLEVEKKVELAAIRSRQEIAEAQARVVGEGLKSANIDIVGGESVFFDRLVAAIGMGKAVDGFVDSSNTGQKMLGDYLDGGRSFATDLKEVLSRPAVSSGDIQNLTVSAVLARLISGADGEVGDKLTSLLEEAKELGLDQVKMTDLS